MTRERVVVKGPAAIFVWFALILLALAGVFASWGVLWRAWGWAF